MEFMLLIRATVRPQPLPERLGLPHPSYQAICNCDGTEGTTSRDAARPEKAFCRGLMRLLLQQWRLGAPHLFVQTANKHRTSLPQIGIAVNERLWPRAEARYHHLCSTANGASSKKLEHRQPPAH
jgi:hypothetical protein